MSKESYEPYYVEYHNIAKNLYYSDELWIDLYSNDILLLNFNTFGWDYRTVNVLAASAILAHYNIKNEKLFNVPVTKISICKAMSDWKGWYEFVYWLSGGDNLWLEFNPAHGESVELTIGFDDVYQKVLDIVMDFADSYNFKQMKEFSTIGELVNFIEEIKDEVLYSVLDMLWDNGYIKIIDD